MSSTTLSMPSASATRRPEAQAVADRNRCSGMRTPSTLFGAEGARRQSAAHTLLIDAAGEADARRRAGAGPSQHLLAQRAGDARDLGRGSRRSASAEKASPAAAIAAGFMHAAPASFGLDVAAADLAGVGLRQLVAELDRLRHHEVLEVLRAVADDVALGQAGARRRARPRP